MDNLTSAFVRVMRFELTLYFIVQVVVVDGNIAAGKTQFAKRLAERFDLKFFPPTREKQLFLLENGYNYDTRGFDSLLPEALQSYDLEKFYSDPHPEHGRVGKLQLMWYREKFMDYLLALRHLVNTGAWQFRHYDNNNSS